MSTRSTPPLEVVCALIESTTSTGKCLLAAQRATGHLAGKWEFPGGKVEPHEKPEEALIREIKEELHCRISILEAYPHFEFDYGNGRPICLIPFLCRTDEIPSPAEHSALTNITSDNWESLDWAEADLPIVRYWLEQNRFST